MVVERVYWVVAVLAFENVERVAVGTLVQFVQEVIPVGKAAVAPAIAHTEFLCEDLKRFAPFLRLPPTKCAGGNDEQNNPDYE